MPIFSVYSSSSALTVATASDTHIATDTGVLDVAERECHETVKSTVAAASLVNSQPECHISVGLSPPTSTCNFTYCTVNLVANPSPV